MRKPYVLLLAIFISGCSVMGIGNYEEPNYEVLMQEEAFEVRHYANILVAQSSTPGNYKEIAGKNFDRLAGYIFGKNVSSEKMDMTTPVLQEQQSEKMDMTTPVFQQQNNTNWTMTFVLPSKYTLETAPKPLDEEVTVKILPEIKVATLTFNGRLNEKNIQQHTLMLEDWVKEKGLSPIASAYSAAYDPPWTLPMLRRNEIHLPIE